MLALLRLSRSVPRLYHVYPNISKITIKNFPRKSFPPTKCCLHTTSHRAAIPPALLLVLRPVLRVVAFFAGRHFRKWWQSLPKHKRAHYWAKIKENKWNIAGGGVLASCMAYWFYVSHLEMEPITGRERFSFISPKQIQELSKIEFQAICLEFADRIVPPTHPYYYRVKKVADRLLRANRHMPQIYTKTWTITVLDDPTNINAFVLPNGNIFVFSGMLNLCSTDDEFAAILGHEISHSLLGHAAENASRENLLESFKLLLILVAWAVLPSDFLSLLGYGLGAGAVNATLRYPYSRQLENEADQVGLQLAAKACYDVRAAVVFWAKMDMIHEADQLAQVEWLSTHPSHKARQEKIEEQLPLAMELRKYCNCPDLPKRDTRKEIEAFRQSEMMNLRPSSLPVGIVLVVPDITKVASE